MSVWQAFSMLNRIIKATFSIARLILTDLWWRIIIFSGKFFGRASNLLDLQGNLKTRTNSSDISKYRPYRFKLQGNLQVYITYTSKRPLKYRRMAFSFLEFFFILETSAFLYYTNKGSDNITRCATRVVKYWIKNIPRNIEAVFLTLGTGNFHYKRNQNCMNKIKTASRP